jgi:hypothetical protein
MEDRGPVTEGADEEDAAAVLGEALRDNCHESLTLPFHVAGSLSQP